MEISAKADYGIRAMAELARAGGGPLKVPELAELQDIPPRFLQHILLQLRRRALVRSHRGAGGGYRLARPAETITIAEIMRAMEGPLAGVRGERPESLQYEGNAKHLVEVWLAVRVSMRGVIEKVSLADVVNGTVPKRLDPVKATGGKA